METVITQALAKPGQYLTFNLHGQSYGVAIEMVREINRLTTISPVPQVPKFVSGVMNLRGKVVPVVDLGTRFDLAESARTKETCVVVIEGLNGQVGAIVDSVSGVVTLAENQIQPSPAFVEGGKLKFVMGMGMAEDRVIILVDIANVLSDQEAEDIGQIHAKLAGVTAVVLKKGHGMNDTADFMARIRAEFLDEADDLLNLCEETFLKLDDPATNVDHLAEIFRAIHTIKGSGAAVGLVDLVEFAHLVEDCLAALRTHPEHLSVELISLLLRCLDTLRMQVRAIRQGGAEIVATEDLVQELKVHRARIAAISPEKQAGEGVAFGFFDNEPEAPVAASQAKAAIAKDPEHPSRRENACVKVDAGRIDLMLDLVGELVVIKSQLINKTESYAGDLELTALVTLLDKTIRELQDKALATRMTPLKPLFLRMQRMARDLSLKLDRSLDFVTQGDDTELDRTVVEMLSDPMVHLVRNAIDHGLETRDERKASGKSPMGCIKLTAQQSGSRVIVRIADDGKGINRERVLGKAIENGLVPAGTELTSLNDQEIFNLILKPGFSTAERITDLSGRGVGLDVVRNQIERLKGQLTISSTPGQGTTFEISLPLTASVTDGMVVDINGGRFVIPMDRIREMVKINRTDVTSLSGGRQVLSVRGHLVPLVKYPKSHVKELVDASMAVVFEHQDQLFALTVTGIIGQMQVVTKPLHSAFPKDVISGAAILGNGEVALVTDIEALVRSSHAPQQLNTAA